MAKGNHTDLDALLAFKKSIHDDPLHALSSWNETTHFCSWNGVTCSKRHPTRVVSITLESQGLVGLLSRHIGNLSFLRIIDLQNNTFSGPIPQEIGRLRRLQVIEFSNNSLGGGIPTNLSQCTNLYYLNLIDNELIGGIVPEIASLITDRVTEVVDPFLHQELNVNEKYWDCIVSILRIGVRCSKQLPRDRMSMTGVVNDLKKIRNVFSAHRNGRHVSPYCALNGVSHLPIFEVECSIVSVVAVDPCLL